MNTIAFALLTDVYSALSDQIDEFTKRKGSRRPTSKGNKSRRGTTAARNENVAEPLTFASREFVRSDKSEASKKGTVSKEAIPVILHLHV